MTTSAISGTPGVSLTAPLWSSDPPSALPRLVVDGQPTHLPVWTARTRRERNRGLLGTDGIEGALWITRCNWVHCIGMRHTIDVVYLSRSGRVVSVSRLRPGRVGAPRPTASTVVEMAAGRAAELGIRRGVRLGTAETDQPAPAIVPRRASG